MSLANLSQYGFFLLTVAVLVKPVGGYLQRVFEGERTFLDWLMRPLERWIYRLARVDLQHEMSWREYASSFILFSLTGAVSLFLILRLQSFLCLYSRNAAYLTSANSVFYNVTTAMAMMAGRFGLAIPALALAGHFARQGRRPLTLGTLPTDTPAFGALVAATALIVGGLSYFPALTLGPILEHLRMTE